MSTRYNQSGESTRNKGMQLKESVVLFPSVGMGHIIPMVELGKLFISHGFSVTIVVVEPPFDASTTSGPFISRVSSEYPSISFHRLPKVVPPPTSKHPMSTFETLRLACPHLLDFLKTIRSTSNVRALVLDMFCTSALDVADELGLPSYFFFPSSASALAAFLFLPTLQSKLDGNFRDLGSSPVHFPGLPPVPASHLPLHMQQRGEANDAVIFHFKRLPRAKGIMINTLEWLEKRAIKALSNGECLPDRTVPPVYSIGPLVANGNSGGGEGGGERHECLTWLDAQPEKSVVFLCFGSMGSFSTEQLKEMAIGLERSGQQFLWVVRSPPLKDDPAARPGARPEPDLEALLPEGFLERTKGKGMVVKSWAPQAEVLAHKSVGGFVSHCGWNSTLEAISCGVPMIAWPLYAEQRMNKVFLVEEAKLAVAMEGYDKDIVSAEEVEKKIRWLMESEDGKAMKDRAFVAKEEVVAARRQKGSSSLAWLELVRDVRKGA